MARSKSNAPSTAIPSSRNGTSSSHTTGHSTIASSASGQPAQDEQNEPEQALHH